VAGLEWSEREAPQVPASDGTRFDLNNFRGRDDPTTTSVIQLDWGISPRHLWSFSFGPFEARDDGVFSQPVQFNGVTFPAGETIQSAYRLYEARATYLYELLPDSQWTIRVGAGAAYQWTSMELLASDNVTYSEADDDRLLPLAVGRLGYSFNENWEIGVDAAGISLSDAEQFDVIVYGTWQMNYHWALSVGYEYYARQADNDTFFNDLRYDIPYIALSYTF
ncbi:MAG: hypothetical protein QNJ73_17565, partial [Gammaproteobacteria bacterium]|nr:hypothetical protein [Gammaproteobacteria bacterium]